ncbi:MAG: ygcS [Planctomycetaceae bacterium]|nr:ygcS [Planctomycetaceae bacterium]
MSNQSADEIPPELSLRQRLIMLSAAFLGWMFAGLEIALFVLIHRPAMISLMVDDPIEGSPSMSPAEVEQFVKQWFAWYQAAFLFGAAAGGWVFGMLGDRKGRTYSLALSVLCYSLFTGACYFASTPFELLVLRFLACLGIGGAWPNTVALVAEAWPDASRPFLAGLLGTAANVGQVLMGLIGLWCDVTSSSWRWVLLVGASPAVIGLWCLRGVPESARWLSARVKRNSQSSGPLQELFRPPLRSRILLGILLGAIPVIGTAANAQWIIPWTDQVAAQQSTAANKRADGSVVSGSKTVKADPKSKARTQISRSSGAVFGSLLGGILATLLGRRLTYFIVSLLTLVASTIIFGWMNPLDPWFQFASFGFGLVGVIYFGWLPLYLPELFPTRVRATGAGISFNTGRVIAAFVVLGTGVLLGLVEGDYAKIGLWTGMIYAVGMIIILFAPRTDGSGLKE